VKTKQARRKRATKEPRPPVDDIVMNWVPQSVLDADQKCIAELRGQVESAKKIIGDLEDQLAGSGRDKKVADLEQKLAAAQKDWINEAQKNGAHIAESMDLQKANKIIKIVKLITAGETDAAIQEILEPLPFIFQLNVRFADDKTRNAAEDELMERLKKTLIETVQQVRIARKPDPAEIEQARRDMVPEEFAKEYPEAA
jgi:hypothetical protein